MKVLLSRAAIGDIVRLRSFLELEAPHSAKHAVMQILGGCASLVTFPNRGSPRTDGSRQLVIRFGASGYLVRYRVEAELEQIVIVRIRHARERRE